MILVNKTIASAKRRLFLSTTALLAASAFLPASNAQAVDDHADWDGVTIVQGQGTVTDTGLGSTTIDQYSTRAIGEAQELHIGTMGSVRINQNSKNALFVGRVVGNHSDPTQILGRLSADGRVMIIDRNGVFFGQNSVVDAAGIAVTTGDVSNADIMDGNENFTFSNFGNGEIVLDGTMNISDAGLAAFVAPTVRNSGVINAKMGTVALASGNTVTLDLYGDGLVEVAVDGALGNSLLENTGTINAEGGTVVMTAQSARDVVDNVINNEGVISVGSVTQKGGKIILSGGNKGKVRNTGTLDASGTEGGSVKVTGQAIELAASSKIKANATAGAAGTVEVLAAETLEVDGKLQAQGEGKSGFIETSAPDVSFGADTEILAGHWLLDPTSITVDAALAAIIEGQLAVGDAEITTPAAGVQLGLINFNSTVDWATANTFTANAINDIYFNGGGGLNATGGGHIVLNAGDDIRMFTGSTGLKTTGGNVTLNAFDEVALRGGAGINANGGNIVINNQTGGFYGFANSLNTTGTGTITLNQRQDHIENPAGTATIQNAIDAINNTGTGLNTINVADGVYEEQLTIDHDNIALIGNPGDPNVPGANTATLLGSGLDNSTGINIIGGLSNVTISGFEITNYDDAINALGGGGSLNINNNTITAIDAGIRAFGWDNVNIGHNIFEVGKAFESDPGAIFLNANTSNIHDNVFSDVGNIGLYGIYIFGDSADTHTIVRNDIDGFGTGIELSSEMTTDIRNNFIRNNGTGIHASGGSVTVFENDLSGNTLAINNTSGTTVNASGNWFGTTVEASVIAQTSGFVDVSPYLASGTDADAGTLGFQGNFDALYVTDNGAQTSGLINEAIGLVTPHGQVFVNDGLYTENVLVNKSLKLTGLTGATLNPEFVGNALITVTASDVNIDPLILDGKKKVNYGVVAKGQGTHNLTIDGNTFRNFKTGGIFLEWTSAGNMNIINNIIEGSMAHGIRVGSLLNGTVLNIENNVIGSESDPLNYLGIDVGRVRNNSSVFIKDNTVYSSGAGISQTYANATNVEVTGNTVRSKGNALSFHGIENGSTVLVFGNDLVSSQGTGVQITSGAINGTTLGASTLTIDGNTIAGNGGYGVDVFYGDLNGNSTLNITNNESISGFFDGIYASDSVFGGVTINISGNGAGAETEHGYVGYGGITGVTGNGIALYGIETSDIRDNYIHDVGVDGIHLGNFGQSWIAYNYITGTGDDGIEVVDGDFVSIYDNTILHVGSATPLFDSLVPEGILELDDGYGADGIHVRNVGGFVPTESGEGFGYGAYGGDSEIYGNNISIVADDGIEVLNGHVNYIGDNVIGHVNGNGISVEGTYITEINGNAVSLALGNGIYVNGYGDYDKPKLVSEDEDSEWFGGYGVYAGIFGNKVLLTGQNGIEVTNIGGESYYPSDISLLGGLGYGDYGWAVNIDDNQVAMTGANGIWAHDSSSVRVHNNDVLAAGLGEDLGNIIYLINSFAGVSTPPLFFAAASVEEPTPTSFDWYWGNGDGIRVNDVYGYGPTGESVDVQENFVAATGGHGINVFNASTARVSYNNVYYSGIDFTTIPGFDSPLTLLSSGPFNDHSGYFDGDEEEPVLEALSIDGYDGDGYPSRRDLWASSGQSLAEILIGYIPFPSEITYDSFDGIHVENIGDYPILLSKFSGPGDYEYDYDLPYSVIIQGNTVDHTGDDGIDVSFTRRTLIGGYGELEGNTISNAGFGYSGSYGPDYNGADGIHASNIFTGFIGMSGIIGGGEDMVDGGYYGYAVDIIGNTISNTQDDGIEVVGSESTLIAYNTISNVGLGYNPYGREYDQGADGINVHDVHGFFAPTIAGESGSVISGDVDPYSVVIIGNNINNTHDDGIEVVNSGRTRIGGYLAESNNINNVGFGDVYGYSDPYYTYGSDAIHVRNVFTNPYYGWSPAGVVSEDPSDHFYDVQIISNIIDRTADDGIQVVYSGDTYIESNYMTNIGYLSSPALASKESIEYEGYGYGAVDMWGADGIHVLAGPGAVGISAQKVAFPIDYGFGNKTAIVNNTIDTTRDDGIETQGVNDLLVSSNTVLNSGDDGINILGYGGFPMEEPDEEFELFLGPVFAPYAFYNAVVTGNTVDTSGGDGIQSSGYDNLEVTDNEVSNSFYNGLYISGFYNGNVLMQGNTFTDNGHTEEGELVGAGARFESGNIDMSDLTRPNFFVNTKGTKALGMQFDPAEMYDYDDYYEYASIFAESIEPVKANLTIVNETIGSTVFSGYAPTGSFYIRFEDGAILDELGNVIVINGVNANFDGIRPALTGGVISPEDLNFIETRLWDADDPSLDGRGQIFVGVAPVGLDNIQDFFNEFNGAPGRSNGLNVTFLGLPPVGPVNLNNITPAAGEGEAQDLANISPAAGGEQDQENQQQTQENQQVGCWSDLSNALGSGKSASITDDGSPESAMAGAVNCGSQQI